MQSGPEQPSVLYQRPSCLSFPLASALPPAAAFLYQLKAVGKAGMTPV